MKKCRQCGILQHIVNFYFQSKLTNKRESKCKECSKKIKREKRLRGATANYYEQIKIHGYFIKTCKIHGGLAYSDIKLRIKKDMGINNDKLWVELLCIKCKKDNDRVDYCNNERYLSRLGADLLMCHKCKNQLEISFFSSSGLKAKYPKCKICASNDSKKIYKEKSLFWRYGISLQDYNLMNKSQNGKCKICNNKNDYHDKLYIDHNHITGKIRGLLCRACNTGLGMFKDSPETMKSAIRYLETHA